MSTQFQYARLARTAQRLIDRFGITENIVGFVDVPNPDQPNRPGSRIEYDQDVSAVFLKIDEKLVDGQLIKSGDMKVLVSPNMATLDVKMTGTISRAAENEVWSIVNIKTLNPGGVKLLYTLQVRR
jgi:hypothetical protein